MYIRIYFWDIPNSKIPWALFRMATNHLYLKFDKRITFYKLLGTGKGETFIPRDANLNRWGLLIVSRELINENKVIRSWRKISINERSFDLAAISSSGKWAKKEPFALNKLRDPNSNIAVITRAKIKNKLAKVFWESVPPVVLNLKESPGLIWAIGIGEAPIGLQGTFSLWENEKSVSNFAFKGKPHAQVIKQTRALGWYSEELFARFEVLSKAE